MIIGCKNRDSNLYVIDPSTFSDIDKEVYLSSQELKSLIETNDDITLIDIRSITEYNESHMEGAIHIPLKDLLNDRTRNIISESKGTVVIYGDTFEKIHGPFMLLNSLHKVDLKILQDSYAGFIDPESMLMQGFDRAKFDFQKEWDNLMTNAVIEAPEGEIPNVAQTRNNVAPNSKKVIPIIPKKKKVEEEEGC